MPDWTKGDISDIFYGPKGDNKFGEFEVNFKYNHKLKKDEAKKDVV